ncbi:MAG: universal stress protein [Deltaproteobacteria bacterium]|nr:universal stress protein [Deltaproteobacteria bacterium]
MLKKILYPTDFSDVAEKALEYVEALKEAGAKEVVVLHVFDSRTLDYLNRYVSTYADGMKITEENKKSTVKLMQEIEQRLEKRGFVATSRLAEGVPAFEIMKVAEEEKVSVVVIGSHGMSNVKEMLLGSVSETVIRKSKMPVVVVKR